MTWNHEYLYQGLKSRPNPRFQSLTRVKCTEPAKCQWCAKPQKRRNRESGREGGKRSNVHKGVGGQRETSMLEAGMKTEIDARSKTQSHVEMVWEATCKVNARRWCIIVVELNQEDSAKTTEARPMFDSTLETFLAFNWTLEACLIFDLMLEACFVLNSM